MCSSSEFWKTRLSGLIIYLLHRINSKAELLSTASKSNWTLYWYLHVHLTKQLKIHWITEMKGTQIQRKRSLLWLELMCPLCNPGPGGQTCSRYLSHPAAGSGPPCTPPSCHSCPSGLSCRSHGRAELSQWRTGILSPPACRNYAQSSYPTNCQNSKKGRLYSVLFVYIAGLSKPRGGMYFTIHAARKLGYTDPVALIC